MLRGANMNERTSPQSEMGKKMLEQAFDIWINPEIERRQKASCLPDSFNLHMAQIIMNVGVPIEVRLNEEVVAVVQMRATKPLQEGQLITSDDFSEIMNVELTDLDQDAGHITMILHNDTWLVSFDFRYNAGRITEMLEAAQEFLEVAAIAADQTRLRPFIELLFSATELLAKGLLIIHPDPKIMKTKTHGTIAAKFNLQGKLGNTDPRHVKLVNQLARLRKPARYLTGDFALTIGEAQEMLADANYMFADLQKQLPARHPIPEAFKQPNGR